LLSGLGRDFVSLELSKFVFGYFCSIGQSFSNYFGVSSFLLKLDGKNVVYKNSVQERWTTSISNFILK